MHLTSSSIIITIYDQRYANCMEHTFYVKSLMPNCVISSTYDTMNIKIIGVNMVINSGKSYDIIVRAET